MPRREATVIRHDKCLAGSVSASAFTCFAVRGGQPCCNMSRHASTQTFITHQVHMLTELLTAEPSSVEAAGHAAVSVQCRAGLGWARDGVFCGATTPAVRFRDAGESCQLIWLVGWRPYPAACQLDRSGGDECCGSSTHLLRNTFVPLQCPFELVLGRKLPSPWGRWPRRVSSQA